ncbi:MAG: aldehyde dehydrogenase, partial [Methanosarcinales archaeon]
MNYKMFINGEWVNSESEEVFEIINPANEEVIGTVPQGTREDGKKALEAASIAQESWEEVPPIKRAKYLHEIARLIRENKEELARLLTIEQGKPLFESRLEIEGTAEHFTYFAEGARWILGDIVPSDYEDHSIMILKVPRGVVVGITPWNFPAAMVARKIAPAIVTGNTIVIKPSSDTPIIALKLAELIQKSKIPNGVVNVVTGSGSSIGLELIENPISEMITMTGSTSTGKKIMESASKHLAKVLLELGGKAPCVILEDADIDWAVKNAVWCRFWNCGQTCICAERIYVHEMIAEEFIKKFIELTKSLKIGNGLEKGVYIGPRINKYELENADNFVKEAIDEGAKLVLGGKSPEGEKFNKGYWYEPTILTEVAQDMKIVREEIFGPVIPIMEINDFDEVIRLCNDSEYGLASYLFTKDLKKALTAANKIKFGET